MTVNLPVNNRNNQEPREKAEGFAGWMKEIAIVFIVALVFSLLIKTFIVKAFFVPSGSMEHTLEIGDRVIANIATSQFTSLKRGDIVIFEDTQGWIPVTSNQTINPLQSSLEFLGLMPDTSSRHMVKRVIGLPGDTVECCDEQGRLIINGEPVDEPYVKEGMSAIGSSFKVAVPDGGIWVMGDNRNQSADSRMHMDLPSNGVVQMNTVVGTVTTRVWPLDRMGFIENQDSVFRLIP